MKNTNENQTLENTITFKQHQKKHYFLLLRHAEVESNNQSLQIKKTIMNNSIHITPFQTVGENFARAFNITEQRETEIDEILDNCYELTDTYPDALAAASQKLMNINELAYASFHLGAFAESRRSKYKLLYKLIGE